MAKDKKNKIKSVTRLAFSEQLTRIPAVVVIITIFVLIVFAGATGNKAIHFDDDSMLENISLVHQQNDGFITEAFSRDAWAGKTKPFFRPLQTFILLSVGNDNGDPQPFFVILLILHLLNSFLIYFLLSRTYPSKLLSLLAALLFSVHPIAVPMVNWVPAIGDSLMTTFVLFSFHAIIFYLQKSRVAFLVIHLLFFTLAVFTKETAIFIAPVIAFYLILNRKSLNTKVFVVHFIILILFWSAIALLFFRFRSIFLQGNDIQAFVQPSISDFFKNLRVIPEMVFKAIFPFNLALAAKFSVLRTVVGILAGISLLYFAYSNREHKSLIFTGLTWFVMTLLPTLVFIHPGYDYLDHRFYLPLCGLLFLVPAIRFNRNTGIIPWLYLPLLLVLTVTYSRAFNDPLSFYDRMVKHNSLPLSYNNRALERMNSGDTQGALEDFDLAIRLNSGYAEAYINRANLKVSALDEKLSAVEDYNRAIEILGRYKKGSFMAHEDYSDVYNNRALVKTALKDISGALEDYEKAVSMNPSYPEAYNNRALLKINELKDSTGAMEDYNRAIELNPGYAQAYNNRGILKEIKFKDYQGALVDYSQAISLNQDYADAFYNRGMCYATLNERSKACADMRKAASLGHESAARFVSSNCR